MSTAPISLECGDAHPTRSPYFHRGLVIGVTAVGIGLCLIRPVGRTIPWNDLSILVAMAAASFFGANEARRLSLAQAQASQEAESGVQEPEVVGPWMTVMVNRSGPADAAGSITHPDAPPRDDPERRSLARRAEERVTVGVSRR